MFSYNSDDLSTTLNQVRRLIGDVNSTSAEFQDEEINFYINQEANIFGAASVACQSLASKYALQVDKRIGELSISASQKYEHYKELTKEYLQKSKAKGLVNVYAGGISKSDKDTQEEDTDRVEPYFTRDLHDFKGTIITSTGVV